MQLILASLTASLYQSDLQCHLSGCDLLYCESSLLHQHAWPTANVKVMQLGFTGYLRTTNKGHTHLFVFLLLSANQQVSNSPRHVFCITSSFCVIHFFMENVIMEDFCPLMLHKQKKSWKPGGNH